MYKWACSSSWRAPPGSKRQDTLGASGNSLQVTSGMEVGLEIWVGHKQHRAYILNNSPWNLWITGPCSHNSLPASLLFLLLITLQCILKLSNYGFSQEMKKLYIVKFASPSPWLSCPSVLEFATFSPLFYILQVPNSPFLAYQCWRAQACPAGSITEKWREFFWSWRDGYHQDSKQGWKQSGKPKPNKQKERRGIGELQKPERAEASNYFWGAVQNPGVRETRGEQALVEYE